MKPRSLMFTLYGDYIQFYGQEIWVGTLINLMEKFGVSESSVRGAILRMVQQDLLISRKVGKKSYYSFAEKGTRRIEDGVRRVYSIRSQKWDGWWRIVSYSIPEEKRDLRNQIRKELNWTGFGMLSNSMWISPNPLESQVMDLFQTYDLREHAVLFSSSQVLSHENEELIAKAWNLEELSNEYKEFIDIFSKKYEELKELSWQGKLTDEQSFVERTNLVHSYRKFLFKDPGFPLDLLPAGWNGLRARDLFWNIHQLISIGAVRYFESQLEFAPDKEVSPNREKAINPFTEVFI